MSADITKDMMELLFGELKNAFDNRDILRKIKGSLIESTGMLGNVVGNLQTEIVKSVMERVFTDLKNEFSSDQGVEQRETLHRIKDVLLASQTALALLVSRAMQSSPQPPTYPPPPPPPPELHVKRPKILMVNGGHTLLGLNIRVSIPKIITRTENSLFSKSFVLYEICTSLRIAGEQKTVLVEKRYSDFCEFNDQLKRMFPLSTIPALPPKRSLSGEKTKDELVEPRRRQLAMWLQYVCVHLQLQSSSLVQGFIGNTHPVPQVPNTTSAVQKEIEAFISGEAEHPEKLLGGSLSSYSRRHTELARKELITISRDLMQLEPQACSATAACANLLVQVEKTTSRCLVLSSLFHKLCEMDSCSSSKRSWSLFREVHPAQVNPNLSQLNLDLQPQGFDCFEQPCPHPPLKDEGPEGDSFYESVNILLETLSFFNNLCLQASRSNIDKIHSMRSSSDLKVDGANIAAREWANLRASRHGMIREKLLSTALSFQLEHSRIADVWQALGQLGDAHATPSSSTAPAASITSNPQYSSVLVGEWPPSQPPMRNSKDAASGRSNSKDGPVAGPAASTSTKISAGLLARMAGIGAVPSIFAAPSKPVVALQSSEDPGEESDNSADEGLDGSAHSTGLDCSSHSSSKTTIAKTGSSGKMKKSIPRLGQKKFQAHIEEADLFSNHDTAGGFTQPPSQGAAHKLSDPYAKAFYGNASATAVSREKIPSTPSSSSSSATSCKSYDDTSVSSAGSAKTYSTAAPSTAQSMAQSATATTTAAAAPTSSASCLPAGDMLAAYGWEEVFTAEGEPYYFHKVTRMSRWDRPDLAVMEAVDARLQESQQQIDSAVHRRRQERAEEKKQQDERMATSELIQSEVKSKIVSWSSLPNRGKSIEELLNTLDTILPECVPRGCLSAGPLVLGSSSPSEVKKAYMKAVRLIHPDKLSIEVSLKTKMLAEAAFILVTEVFDAYRSAHGL